MGRIAELCAKSEPLIPLKSVKLLSPVLGAGKLLALGCVQEIYEPAYVEDLDLGYRGWARGWPTVFVSGARVEHRHRATTSRYYSGEQLSAVLEVNYLRFLTSAVSSAPLFGPIAHRSQRSDPLAQPPVIVTFCE